MPAPTAPTHPWPPPTPTCYVQAVAALLPARARPLAAHGAAQPLVPPSSSCCLGRPLALARERPRRQQRWAVDLPGFRQIGRNCTPLAPEQLFLFATFFSCTLLPLHPSLPLAPLSNSMHLSATTINAPLSFRRTLRFFDNRSRNMMRASASKHTSESRLGYRLVGSSAGERARQVDRSVWNVRYNRGSDKWTVCGFRHTSLTPPATAVSSMTE